MWSRSGATVRGRKRVGPFRICFTYMFDCGEVELAARETAAGPMVFEVRHGNAVEVELASAAHQRLVSPFGEEFLVCYKP